MLIWIFAVWLATSGLTQCSSLHIHPSSSLSHFQVDLFPYMNTKLFALSGQKMSIQHHRRKGKGLGFALLGVNIPPELSILVFLPHSVISRNFSLSENFANPILQDRATEWHYFWPRPHPPIIELMFEIENISVSGGLIFLRF